MNSSVVQLAADLLKSGVPFKSVAARYGSDVVSKAVGVRAGQLTSYYKNLTAAIKSGGYLLPAAASEMLFIAPVVLPKSLRNIGNSRKQTKS